MEGSGFDYSAVTTGVQSAVDNVLSLTGDLIPIALSVFAVFWGVRKALSFFKRTAN